jgi:hypothetical protein
MVKSILILISTGSLLFLNSISEFSFKENLNSTIMTDSLDQEIIIDSDYSAETALSGISIPDEIKRNLRLVNVNYYSFDNKLHSGQLVINKNLISDIKKIFSTITEKKFPVAKVIPIIKYNWNDEESMEDNNTSAFNYRFIAGTKKLSNHSFGTAIDINPLFNPYIRKDLIQPSGAVYKPDRKGTITTNSFLVEEFKTLGWVWGGDWKDRKDYQHFEKVLK